MKRIMLLTALMSLPLVAEDLPAKKNAQPVTVVQSVSDNFNPIATADLLKGFAGFSKFSSYSSFLKYVMGMCFVYATAAPHEMLSRYRKMNGFSKETADFFETATGTAFLIACMIKAGFMFKGCPEPVKK